MAVRKNDDVKNRTQKKQNQSREKLQRVLCREELWNSSVCYCNAVLYLVLFCTLVSLVLYLVFQCIVVQLCGWQCGSVAVWLAVAGGEKMNCCLWQQLPSSSQDTDFQIPNWGNNKNTRKTIK